jgi:hypothetical protein
MEEITLKLVLSLLDELDGMKIIQNKTIIKKDNKYIITFDLTEEK